MQFATFCRLHTVFPDRKPMVRGLSRGGSVHGAVAFAPCPGHVLAGARYIHGVYGFDLRCDGLTGPGVWGMRPGAGALGSGIANSNRRPRSGTPKDALKCVWCIMGPRRKGAGYPETGPARRAALRGDKPGPDM